ncbi:MAG TPA: protein kinase, partial [Thermoanaerobaculia bacterium]
MEPSRATTPLEGGLGPTIPASVIVPGQVLAGRYEVSRLLGRGGMAEVWLATDLKLRMDVCLKDTRRNIVREEVRAAREVVSPNVCRVFDLVDVEGRELLSMEFVDGWTLSEILSERGCFHVSEAQQIASQFLAGVDAIHRAGLLHRDLKPDNVMITRAGRVVIMDFGLARPADVAAALSGTPGYVAPEVLAGEPADVRSDLYSAALVLKCLVDAGSAWEGILREGSSPRRNERFESASAFARAIEAVTRRALGEADRNPYPGIAAFSREDGRFFYGHESELEGILRKIERHHLIGLIGPSGAGKTSFLQAGLIPLLLPRWRIVEIRPATDAITAEDVEEWSRWRAESEVLLIVDQFEELFALLSPDARALFVRRLTACIYEHDMRAIVSMRDDFFSHCTEYDGLSPLFSEVTALRPLSGAALRRPLIEPALLCGYRFEDEELIEEIISDTGAGPGSLPLLAFTARRLWELRNRETGVIERASYHAIGGVKGALANHAERAVTDLAVDSEPIVREIFRNLVTAHGTRAARRRDELVSSFDPPLRPGVSAVLDHLISQRILSSTDEAVEIIHESLLTVWMRLAHWRNQDADTLVMRDRLRDAARMWSESGRSNDLVWKGEAYAEFALWRARYQSRLSNLEESYVAAMVAAARRRRRRVQTVAAGVTFTAVLVATVFGFLFYRSRIAEARAVAESQRAEAQKLLAFSQALLDRDPSSAFAYAVKSLELSDTAQGRRRLVEIVAAAPVARFLPASPRLWTFVEFSADGEWMAATEGRGPTLLIRRDGDVRRLDFQNTSDGPRPLFSPAGELLAIADPGSPQIRIIDVLNERTRSLSVPEWSRLFLGNDALLSLHIAKDNTTGTVRATSFADSRSRVVATFAPGPRSVTRDVSWRGLWSASLHDGGVYRARLDAASSSELLWKPKVEVDETRVDGREGKVAAVGPRGIELWDANAGVRWLPLPPGGERRKFVRTRFDASGARIAVSGKEGSPRVWVWNLDAWSGATPVGLLLPVINTDVAFDPRGQWIATPLFKGAIALWPITDRPSVFKTEGGLDLAFAVDGTSLIVCSQTAGLHVLPRSAHTVHSDFGSGVARCDSMRMHSDGRTALIASWTDGVFQSNIDTGRWQQMLKSAAGERATDVAIDASGRMFAAYSVRAGEDIIAIWRTGFEADAPPPLVLRFPAAKNTGLWNMDFGID